MLFVGSLRGPVLGQPHAKPGIAVIIVRELPAFDRCPDDVLDFGARYKQVRDLWIKLAIFLIAKHKTLVSIVQDEPLGYALDRIAQPVVRLGGFGLGPLALGNVVNGPGQLNGLSRLIALEFRL